MSDLVKRLRSIRGNFIIPIESPPLFQWAEEAADLIESQADKIERLTTEISDQKNTIRQMQNKINKAGGLALIKASHEFIRETLAIKGEGK